MHPLALEEVERIFVALPIDKLDRMALQRKADEIGRLRAAAEQERP